MDVASNLHPFFTHRLDAGPMRLATIAHAFNYRVAVLRDGVKSAARVSRSRKVDGRIFDDTDSKIATNGFHDIVIENLVASPTWRSRHICGPLSFVDRAMAIAQLTELHISIPESGAPPGQVPEVCFPVSTSSRGLTSPRHVYFANDVTVLDGAPPLDNSPDIVLHDPLVRRLLPRTIWILFVRRWI